MTARNPDEPRGDAPLISVIVPCFNVERYVTECITSILGQDLKQLEVVAVNDASTDSTGALLDGLARGDARLRVLHLERNAGLHVARAAGFKVARGLWIGFVDGDDRIEPAMYGALLARARDEHADIAICGSYHFGDVGKARPYKVRFEADECVQDGVLERFARLEFGSGVLWNKLYARRVVAPGMELPLHRRLDSGADHIVAIGCFSRSKRVALVKEMLHGYRVRTDSMSNVLRPDSGFSLLLDCHAASLHAYADEGPAVIAAIDMLYGRQYRFEDYRLKGPGEPVYAEQLRSALRMMADASPWSAYRLVHAFDQEGEAPVRSTVRYHLGALRVALRDTLAAIINGRWHSA